MKALTKHTLLLAWLVLATTTGNGRRQGDQVIYQTI